MKNYSDFGHVLSFKIENDSENSSGVKSCVLLIFGAQIQIKVTLLEFPKIPYNINLTLDIYLSPEFNK